MYFTSDLLMVTKTRIEFDPAERRYEQSGGHHGAHVHSITPDKGGDFDQLEGSFDKDDE